MGRPKGSKNKSSKDAKDFVSQVFRERNPHKLVIEMLDNPDERSKVFIRLMEYLYGKPKESIELSGSVTYREVLMRARAQREANANRPITD